MDRRAFIAMLGGSFLTVPLAATAQQTSKVRRIGLLMVEEFPPSQRQDIRMALREQGWTEGMNLFIESRSAQGNVMLLPALADELVKLNVEIIVGAGTVASIAAKNATPRVPIVIYGSGDPIQTGLVASLARPGGNITGNTSISPELDVKRLELMRELLPSVRRVGELVNPTNPVFRVTRDERENVYRALGLQPIFVEVTAVSELDGAVGEVAKRGGQVLKVGADPLFATPSHLVQIIRAAQRLALPTMVEGRLALEAGGLFSLSNRPDELNRQLAVFIDRILKGAKPADLPIERPTQFELLINLKTARAFRITVPPSLLLRADGVFQ